MMPMVHPTANKRLENKKAVVTGAAMGLGEATARKFGREGAQVACLDLKQEPNERVVESIRSEGGLGFSVIGDVGSATDVKRMVQEANQHLGGIDILVNNAGIIRSWETVVDTSEEDWDETLRVNLKGVFLMSKSVIPYMIAGGSGSIINISSILGLVGIEVRPAYSASKGGVSILTRQMATDFGKENIRVNAINPSFIITNINKERFDQMKADNQDAWQKMLDRHPLGRLGEPEDVAHAAVYLASDESRWVTGVLLPVDGGYTTQ